MAQMFDRRPTFAADDRKLRALILYIAARTMNDPHMGSMKLNKVLFYSDFGAYLHLGAPITGHPYFRLENGPAPVYLRQIRDQMVVDGWIRLVKEDSGAKHKLDRVQALRDADLSLFSGEQLAYVDAVIESLRESTGTAVSDESHLMMGWRLAKHKEMIPYPTAFLGRATKADLDRGVELARMNGWA